MRWSVEGRRNIVYSSSTRTLTAYLTGTHIEDDACSRALNVSISLVTKLLLLSKATRHAPGGWEGVACRVLEFYNEPPSSWRSYETQRVKRAPM